MEFKREEVMRLLYVNHRGQVAWRLVVPLKGPNQVGSPQIEFGSPHHPAQWVFRVWDLDKQAERSYAFSGIIWAGMIDATPPTHFTLTYGKPRPYDSAAPA